MIFYNFSPSTHRSVYESVSNILNTYGSKVSWYLKKDKKK